MVEVTVTRLVLPETWDEDTPIGRAYREVVALNRDVRAHFYGTPAVAPGPASHLALYRDAPSERCASFSATRQGRVVGRLILWLPLLEAQSMIEGGWVIAPDLPDAEHAAVASELLAAVERFSAAEGRPWLLLEVPCRPGPLVPASGVGGADPEEPSTAALLARGFTLRQLYRYQLADLANLPDLDARLSAAAVPGHHLVTWAGRVPAPHREAFCALASTMVDEIPSGGVQFESQHWDEARLRGHEELNEKAGRTFLGALAYSDAGAPAGYTELMAADGEVAHQGDTLVAPEYRGRGVARWLKLANLAQLRAGFPRHRYVTTDNATENTAMLAINDAIGFRTVLQEGLWERRPATDPDADGAAEPTA